MDRIALDARARERHQAAAVRHIDADREQIGQELSDCDIVEHPDRRTWVELDQDVDVAPRARLVRATEPNSAGPERRAAVR